MPGGPDRQEPGETTSPNAGPDQQVGTAAEEAARLLESLAGWVGDHIATGDEECQICPICVLIRSVRDVNPDAVRHLAVAGWSLAAAAHAFLDGTLQAGRPPSSGAGARGSPAAAADGSTGYGASGHSRSPTRIDISDGGTVVGEAQGSVDSGDAG